MFSIKYTFQKGGPKYKCEYPDEELKKYNIFIAKGPNDRGKSTMVQMIAYGLYGLEYEDINESLKEKMKRLTSETTDICDFDYDILSHDKMLNLRSVLKDKNSEPQVFINNNIRGMDYIKENFKIVYDIPGDPTKKLESSLTSIKENLKEYQGLIAEYKTEILKMIDQIGRIEGKESTLKRHAEHIKFKEKDLSQLDKRRQKLSLELPRLEKANNVIKYNKFKKDHEIATKDFNGLKHLLKEHESKGAGGGNKKYKESLINFNSSLDDLKILFNSTNLARRLNSEDKKTLETLKEKFLNIHVPTQYDTQLTKNAYFFFSEKLEHFKSLPLYQKKLEEEDQINLFEKLIDILKSFIDKNIEIPGTNGKNIAQFLDELEEQKLELWGKLTEKNNLEEDIKDCKKFKDYLDKLISAKNNLPEKNDLEEEYENLKEQLKEKKKEVDKLFAEIVQYTGKVEKISASERRSLEAYDESIFGIYTNTKSELDGINARIESINLIIDETNDKILSLNKLEEKMPIYSKEELTNLNRIAENIERKIINGMKCIDKLKENKVEDSKECNEFYDALSIYFANIIQLVYFENKSWQVTKVDIKKKMYEVKERSAPIEFVDIGTGHTELNSLIARLKQPSLGKYKIILFDEMSTMDEKNFNLLISEIKNQIRNGEAIFAFLNRPDEKLDKVIFEAIEC